MAPKTPELEASVAKAIYLEMARQARAQVSAVEIDCDEIDAVMEEALSQTDRGAAILIFSYIETIMHRVFCLHLNNGVKGGLNSLLENNGPLSTASNRIRMLAALSWLEPDTSAGLDILRLIRNQFAHNIATRSFDDRKVSGWISSLPPLERRMEKVSGLEGVFSRANGMTNRHLFLARATLLVWNLAREAYVMPFSRKYQVHHSAVAGDYDGQPDNLKALSRRFSRTTLLIVKSFAPEIFERSQELVEREAAEAKTGKANNA